MTNSMVRGLERIHAWRQKNSDDSENDGNESEAAAIAIATASSSEPSLDAPAVGKPISHGQVVDLWEILKRNESTDEATDAAAAPTTLEALLVGAKVYVPPPSPKPEPSDEYKALMARLRHDEEARAYERMVNPPEYHAANEAFARVNRPVYSADAGDDEVTLNDVHRQVMLILNFVLTMGGVAYTLWVLARWWPTPSRLFLSMGGSVLVGLAEYGLYAGYVWHLSEAKSKDEKEKEMETKQVLRTWLVGAAGVEEKTADTASALPFDSKLSSGAATASTGMAGDELGKSDLTLYRHAAEPSATMGLMTPDTPSSRSPTNPKTMAASAASSPSSSPTPTTPSTDIPPPRRRTIRTYGKKRPLADSADEDGRHPAPSVRTANAASDSAETVKPTSSKVPSPPSTTASDGSSKKHKRSGILRYFQPAPLPRSCTHTTSSSSSQCSAGESDRSAAPESTSQTAAVTGTPPPSPPRSPPTARPRQKRRLNIRPDIPDVSEKKAESDTKTARPEEDAKGDGQDRQSQTGSGTTASSVRMRARMRARMLGMCGLVDQEQQASARKKTPTPAASTQTTLSLTIGGDAMKECTECNILYNPLHEKDAKFHARYHASLRRKRARQEAAAAARTN
ncbi:hypothetical protein CMQ_3295 [Grosmannia clavigera kw1407]|uniref:N-acetyltransferase ESCO zinc-finger domain-containing protein n=1 Tax=Grosmannia clavigera (strain kw1407 / UAMH 11150) TaxID=655863 RepID=F0X8Z6_GROCL|nr:uncharacterized protein CMQ_3295 [Grosmannia clavigera kw1407]EFX05226.1 hypothetical protein CMQ_3295 [Grosmannia clavigera kw1407]